VLAILSLAACQTTSTFSTVAVPSATNDADDRIELIGSEPVLKATDLGPYGAILPAAYFEADGVRHAYLIGFGEQQGDQRAFHATSPDGTAWTVDEADPFADLGLDLSPPGPIPGSVLQADDGSWLMYLWGVPSPQSFGAVIWRATAQAPGGPWAADPEPVLTLGASGEWDDLGIDFPAVSRTDDGFVMLYSASNNANREASAIGLATSADGIGWEKAAENPVVTAATCGDEDPDQAAVPRPVPGFDGVTALVYLAGREARVAESSDLRTWTCASQEPVLSGADVPGGGGIHTIAASLIDGEISVLVESLVGNGSELWLATLGT
jgi:hypothetical protein